VLAVDDLPESRLGVDLVVSTYVYNIIDDPRQRRRYLGNAAANLRPGGMLLMEVSCGSEQLSKNRQGGSAAEPGGRNYSHRELDRLLACHRFQRLCHYYRHHAVAALYRLAEP
jgi:hypothetical protein